MPASSQKPRPRVGVKDVARRVGCSSAVASKVLNGAKGNIGVSEQMRRRVEAAAREMGYRRNYAARSLVTQQSHTLGVYLAPVDHGGFQNPFYEPAMVGGVEEVCRAMGYDLLVVNLAGREPPSACTRYFEERRIDGLVLMHVHNDEPWLGELLSRNAHVVAIDYFAATPKIPRVCLDNQQAIRLAVDHLYALGHRRIGYLGACHEPGIASDTLVREHAFLDVLSGRGLDVCEMVVHDRRRLSQCLSTAGDFCRAEGQLGADYMLNLPPDERPTALVAYNDLVAIEACERLKERGVRVPEDISVVGIDDTVLCRHMTPRLTSIRHPLEQMGRLAADLVIRLAKGEHVENSNVIVCPELVIRESSSPVSI